MADAKARIHIATGDITKFEGDAIVNAANTSLLGGGGVDGAIHRAAGPELVAECRMLHGCRTGEAKITRGYGLPARWVIHTVGPVWQDGTHDEDALLAAAWRNSLARAAERGVRTIAFPSISTGAFRFPLERAARIAVATTLAFLRENEVPESVTVVCFGDEAYGHYLTALTSAD